MHAVVLLGLLGGPSALADTLVAGSAATVEIGGMDCAGCEGPLDEALAALPFVAAAHTSYADGSACVELSQAGDAAALVAVVTGRGFEAGAVTPLDACPTAPTTPRDPWADTAGLDAVIISRGERVDLKASLASDKFTVVDVGAPWCAPCHTSAATLRAYLAQHDDVAVRVISLDGADAKASYALPVVAQHLSRLEAIPWFAVYSPSGRRVHAGNDVERALEVIDRKRGRR